MNNYLEKNPFVKDVIKFYAYAFILHGVALLFLWGHLYLTFETFKFSMNDIVSNHPLPEPRDMEFYFEYYEILSTCMKWCIPALVSFGVFFTKSPKPYKRFLIGLCIIMTISFCLSLLTQQSLTEIILINLCNCFSIVLAWACSVVRYKTP